MNLEKLELFGFKSFADKTILKFTPEITCVVGPNGSGKTNILDSIRWVAGEQSLKTLRGKKSSDVIFSGSSKRARSGMVEVSLFLNNEDGKAPIDYANLVISRRLYRNGEGEYLINKKKVRLQDIILLLAQANFGQKSYGIVSQGMTDYILTCSLKERKDFFDEAAGVKHYQIKREQAMHKLERSQDNLKQGELMLNEITPHLRSLTRQVNRLKKREAVEKGLIELQKEYYAYLWQGIDYEFQENSVKLHQLDKKCQEQTKTVNSLKQELSKIVDQELEDKILEKFQQEQEELLTARNDFLTQQAILKGRIEMEKVKISQGVSHKTNIISQQKIKQIINGLEEINLEQTKFIESLTEIRALDELDNLKEKAKSINQKLTAILSDFQQKPAEQPENKGLIDLEKESKNLLEKISEFEKKIQAIKNKISDYNQKELGKRKELFNLQKDYQTEQNKLDQLISQRNEIKIDLSKTETHKEDLEQEITREMKTLDLIVKHPQVEKINPDELRDQIDKLKYKLELIGGIDPEITQEYEETKERFDFLSGQITDLKKTISDLKKLSKELEQIIEKQFNAALKEINEKFNQYFKTLFNGGKAKLILRQEIVSSPEEEEINLSAEPSDTIEQTNAAEDLSAEFADSAGKAEQKTIVTGLEIQAILPGKKVKSINALSGGERALTSLALICAVIAYNPPPFVVLDEADAALDEANSQRFSAILEQLSHKTQFIVITHNRVTMEKAKILYGVTLNSDGTSKLLSVDLEQAKEVVK